MSEGIFLGSGYPGYRILSTFTLHRGPGVSELYLKLEVLQMVTYNVVIRLTFIGFSYNKPGLAIVYHKMVLVGDTMSDDTPFRNIVYMERD